jgi:S-adenosylmethionine synthetase
VAYAIGVAKPMNLYVNTYGTNKTKFSDSEIAQKMLEMFDMRPYAIEQRLKLRNPIYQETASYGHFGRTPETMVKRFNVNGTPKEFTVELFTWEKTDYAEAIRKQLLL